MSDKQNDLETVVLETLNQGCTQLRCKMNLETVTTYSERYEVNEAGELVTPLPPIIVFRDGRGSLHLADGFHRVAAAKKAGLLELPAMVLCTVAGLFSYFLPFFAE